jgi:hypothetical protein
MENMLLETCCGCSGTSIFGCLVTVYLNLAYENQCISHAGSVPWPSRSPDLTFLDLFLHDFMKKMVYKQIRIELTCHIIQVPQNQILSDFLALCFTFIIVFMSC